VRRARRCRGSAHRNRLSRPDAPRDRAPDRFFVNTVTIRADLRGDPTFPALLTRIRQTSLEATSHQDVPFEYVVQTLQPDRRTGNMPLFQVMFAMPNASSSVRSFTDLVVTPLDVHNGTSKCDLVLNIGPHRDGVDGLCCQLEFDTDLFDATTATRFLESCRLVLEGIATEAERPISVLPLVTEERSVITAWARTPGEYPRTSFLHASSNRWPSGREQR
jgi:non-ribosomal peptide synthetase component F